MLEGPQWCFCTRCKRGSIFPTCPGSVCMVPRTRFMRTRGTWWWSVVVPLINNTVFIHVPREQAQTPINYRCLRNLRTMHRILAQESCACTRFFCMHKSLVHAQNSCACTRFLCMQFLSLFGLIVDWVDLLGSICPLFVAICVYFARIRRYFRLFAVIFLYSPLFAPIRRYFNPKYVPRKGNLIIWRFCRGWGPYKRHWSAGHIISSEISIQLYLFICVFQQATPGQENRKIL